jgi:hypothetical protein
MSPLLGSVTLGNCRPIRGKAPAHQQLPIVEHVSAAVNAFGSKGESQLSIGRSIRPMLLAAALVPPLVLVGMGVNVAGFALPPIHGAPATSSKLGDLSAYRTIAIETKTLAEKGDLPGAAIRISDLESSWEAAEVELQSRASLEWHVLDRAVDRAVTVTKASSRDAATRGRVLADLLCAFDTISGKAPGASCPIC